jgi:hypothetical protein
MKPVPIAMTKGVSFLITHFTGANRIDNAKDIKLTTATKIIVIENSIDIKPPKRITLITITNTDQSYTYLLLLFLKHPSF